MAVPKLSETNPKTGKSEVVIGLVGATGTPLHKVATAVKSALGPYGYKGVDIRLSTLMHEVKGGEFLKNKVNEETRILRHMDAGDAIRYQADRNDAVVGLAIGYISEYRKENFDEAEALDTAFILDSLKHPDEVETMRKIYGDRFTLISVHAPTGARLNALQKKIAASRKTPQKANTFKSVAEKIMKRDEHDDDHRFGQNVRETFVEGDVYISTQSGTNFADEIKRYLGLFFGNPFLTPTQDEYAMFQTHAAALRSADLSRQVGAAICTKEGQIIAVGCNEVPKAFGGQYWPGDKPDGRDFELGYDSNVKQRDEALVQAFDRLKKRGQLADSVNLGDFAGALQGTRLSNITEFGRTVHAEMASLLDAARRGVSVQGHRLFTTTFPCHNCARHIIGAGVKEVVYREPYEKSLASHLHEDALVIDPAGTPSEKVVVRRFVGIGPPKYLDLFAMPTRKDDEGNKVDWSEETAEPRLVKEGAGYLTNEEDFLDEFLESLKAVKLERGI
jgi:cytidine deaminase